MLQRKVLGLLIMSVLIGSLAGQAAYAQDSGAAVRTIPLTSKGYGIKLSPDGRTAAVFENGALYDDVDKNYLPIRLIDMSTGKQIGSLSGQSDYTTDVAFTPDGKRLASYHRNGSLYLWDVEKLSPIKHIETTFVGGKHVKFMPDGKTLVILVGGNPSRFLLWDLDTGYITAVLGPHFASYEDLEEQAGPRSDFSYLDFQYVTFDVSPDGKTLASSTVNGEVDLWNIASGEQTVLRPASEEKGQLAIRLIAFAPDGATLVYADVKEQKIHFWNVQNRTEGQSISANAAALALSPDGSVLAWLDQADESFTLRLAKRSQLDQPQKVMELPSSTEAIFGGTGLFFSPDGQQLVLGGLVAVDDNNAIYVISLK